MYFTCFLTRTFWLKQSPYNPVLLVPPCVVVEGGDKKKILLKILNNTEANFVKKIHIQFGPEIRIYVC